MCIFVWKLQEICRFFFPGDFFRLDYATWYELCEILGVLLGWSEFGLPLNYFTWDVMAADMGAAG